jgi:hypothetical protein
MALQQRDHGAGDADRRKERVAVAIADLPDDGGVKPSEVTRAEAGGKLHDPAHRLEGRRPQPGRRGVRAPEQFRVAERSVDRRDYALQQSSRLAGIAGGWDGLRELHPTILIMYAEERQTKQQVQVVAAWSIAADLGCKSQERSVERVIVGTPGGMYPSTNPVAVCNASSLLKCPAVGRNRPPVEPADHLVEVEPVAVFADWRREFGVTLPPLGDRGTGDAREPSYLRL